MFQSVPVDWNNEAYLASDISKWFTDFVSHHYIFKTYATTAWGSAFNFTTHRIESLISRTISLVTDHSNTNQLEMSPIFSNSKVCMIIL